MRGACSPTSLTATCADATPVQSPRVENLGFWKIVVARALVFIGALFATLLPVLLLVSPDSAATEGEQYSATVFAKAVPPGAATGCRLVVDPSAAPPASPAPSRVTSPQSCDALPAVGQPAQLSYIDAATTRLVADSAPAGLAPSPVLLGGLGAFALVLWGLFAWLTRRLNAHLDGLDAGDAVGA